MDITEYKNTAFKLGKKNRNKVIGFYDGDEYIPNVVTENNLHILGYLEMMKTALHTIPGMYEELGKLRYAVNLVEYDDYRDARDIDIQSGGPNIILFNSTAGSFAIEHDFKTCNGRNLRDLISICAQNVLGLRNETLASYILSYMLETIVSFDEETKLLGDFDFTRIQNPKIAKYVASTKETLEDMSDFLSETPSIDDLRLKALTLSKEIIASHSAPAPGIR